MKLIMLGPPGVGKGTQAQKMSEKFGIKQISTGDILRDAIKNNTELGMMANNYVSKGELVPDALMLNLIEATLFGENSPSSFVLDGFPRTIPQAKALNELFKKHNTNIDAVLLLDADFDLITKRLSARRVCKNCQAVYNLLTNPPKVKGKCDKCGGELYQRDDDKPDTINKRLDVYKTQTEPLIGYYKEAGLLKKVDSSGSPEEIFNRIVNILGG
jgi:adenylate kinase